MLHGIVQTQPDRPVTFIHAAIDGAHHALRDEVEGLAKRAKDAHVYFVYERPSDADVKEQRFHQKGFVTLDWLQSVVPDKSAEFYFCGPLAFMKAIYRALTAWGVEAAQLHYEVFGPAVDLNAGPESDDAAKELAISPA
jgi:nitric oxide dioxygenase